MKTYGNWLALLLVASMATWTIGCGGEKAGDGAGADTADTDGHDDDDHDGDHDHGDDDDAGHGTKTTGGDTPAEATEKFFGAIEAQKPGEAWAMLPASYQADVDELIHDFADKMPTDTWEQGFGLLQKSLTILKEKKEFVLANPTVGFFTGFIPGFDIEKVAEPYDGTLSVLIAIAKSDVSDIEKLRTADTGSLLQSTAGDVMKQFEEISAALPNDPYQNDFMKSLKPLKIETVKSSDTTATLEVTRMQQKFEFKADDPEPKVSWEEQTETVEMVKVEGKWIPKEMADEFPAKIAEAKENLAKLTPEMIEQGSAMVQQVIATFEPAIDKVGAAETQEEFNAAVDELMALAQQFGSKDDAPPE